VGPLLDSVDARCLLVAVFGILLAASAIRSVVADLGILSATSAIVAELVFAVCDSVFATMVNVDSVSVVSVYEGVAHCSSVLESSSADLSIGCLSVAFGSIDVHGEVVDSCVSGISIWFPCVDSSPSSSCCNV